MFTRKLQALLQLGHSCNLPLELVPRLQKSLVRDVARLVPDKINVEIVLDLRMSEYVMQCRCQPFGFGQLSAYLFWRQVGCEARLLVQKPGVNLRQPVSKRWLLVRLKLCRSKNDLNGVLLQWGKPTWFARSRHV